MSALDDFFGDDNQNEIKKCDVCGTKENLTVHFGMNAQTGRYNFHLCASCNNQEEKRNAAETEKRDANVLRNIIIAETDN